MKKKTWAERLAAASLAGVMLAGMTACGSQSGTASLGSSAKTEDTVSAQSTADEGSTAAQTAGTGEPVEISIAVWNADQAFSGEDDVKKTIEDKLNIKIKPVNVTWDDYTQKVQLWASSGSLPDVFIGAQRTTVTYPQWADQGVIREIPEDLSAYPNLQSYLSGDAAQEAKIDGKLYCIPRQTYPNQAWTANDRIVLYRWDLAQKAGITKEPETWDEFQDIIKAIIKADPDGTGIGGMTAVDPNLVNGVIMPYASPLVMDGGSIFKWEKDDSGKYIPAYFNENMEAGFQLARDMYDSGVIEKDIVMNTGDQGKDKFLQGKAAAICCSGGYENLYSSVGRYWKDVHGEDYTDDVKALALMPDVNGNISYYAAQSYAWSESYISGSVSDEKLDAILRLYDYLLSDEGSFLSLYGPEGDMWEFDSDGKVSLKDDTAVVSDKYPSTVAFGILARWNPAVYDDRYVPESAPAEYLEKDKPRVEQAEAVKLPEFYPECTEQVMKLGIDFTITPEDDFLTIMTGTDPVSDMWASVKSDYESKGLQDMIDQVNEAMGQ